MAEKNAPDTVEKFNEALATFTPYRVAIVDPNELVLLERNAHFMARKTFDQLKANITKDHNLSTLPFCWKRPDGLYEVLSGNHRVMAAKDAGLTAILVLFTDKELSADERAAIALSHNALVGQDDATLLREIWNDISTLEAKVYSGLDEELLFTLPKVSLAPITDENLRFEELGILFLPSEIARVKEVAERLKECKRERLAGRLEDFDRFFEALLDFKSASGILNTSAALLAICDIVEEFLQQETAQQEPADAKA